MEQNLQSLKAENDRLERKLYFKEREVKDLQMELDNASTLIDELTTKNAELQRLLADQQSSTLQAPTKRLTGDDFRRILGSSPIQNTNHSCGGLETEWSPVMMVFSDAIFWEQNSPDIVLYRDDDDCCYRTMDGDIRLGFPIMEKDLLELGWDHYRPIDESEMEEVIRTYKL